MSVRLLVTGSLAAAALALAGCASSGGSGSSTTPPPTSGGPSSSSGGGSTVALSVGSTDKGMVLTDNGRTLYTFDPDTATSSACTGACATTWPPVVGTATPGTGLTASDFGNISRSDGTKQVTYMGNPVYEFAGDKAAGDTKGDGIQGTWHVATVSGAGSGGGPASSAPASAPNSAPASSGGGYNY
jgi:predicted lipoprotein with Yx(FWY)xxD motif